MTGHGYSRPDRLHADVRAKTYRLFDKDDLEGRLEELKNLRQTYTDACDARIARRVWRDICTVCDHVTA